MTQKFFRQPQDNTSLLWGGPVLMGFCLFWVIGGLPGFEDNLGAMIIGIVGLTVFIPGTWVVFYRRFSRKPTAIISRQGLTIYGSTGAKTYLRWEQISNVEMAYKAGRQWICISLVSSREVIGQAPLWRRPKLMLNFVFYRRSVFIPVSEILDPFMFIATAKKYLPRS